MASILNRKIQTSGLQQAATTIIIILCCFIFALVPPKSSVVVSSTYNGIRKLMSIDINGGDNNLTSSNTSYNIETNKEMELMLGSTPPRCDNSCRSCRPCNAVLVVPPNLKRKVSSFIRRFRGRKRLTSAPSTSSLPATMVVISTTQRQEEEEEEESYYLLSWKCRCKNKLFQP